MLTTKLAKNQSFSENFGYFFVLRILETSSKSINVRIQEIIWNFVENCFFSIIVEKLRFLASFPVNYNILYQFPCGN